MQSSREGINYPIEFMRIAGVILITFTHIRHDFTEGTSYFILETLPKYGTLLLSIISGYLFYSSNGIGNLLNKKITSLLVPYLIANIAVLLPVITLNALGYNFLNRLGYDMNLLWNGLFALRDVPVNPPTYFIRDLFVIFCFLSLLRKDYRALIFLLPLALFGKILLRWDIAALFLIGFMINKYRFDNASYVMKNSIGIPLVILSFLFFQEYQLYKYAIAILFFLNIINIKFRFKRTGPYTYLLHLYHSPVIVFTFPLLSMLYLHPYLLAAAQILFAVATCYIMYLILKRLNLTIIYGNR